MRFPDPAHSTHWVHPPKLFHVKGLICTLKNKTH